MELNYLLDTNIVLYYLGGKLKRQLPNGRYIVSFVTEIELLSYPELTAADELVIRDDTHFQRIGELRCKALPIK